MATSTASESRFASGIAGGGAARAAGGKGTKETTPPAEDSKKTKKGKRINLKSKKSILAIVALLAVGGGAYKTLAPKPPVGPPVGGDFVNLDPTTLNLAGGHYLKIAVSIQLVKGKATATAFQNSQAAALTISEFSNRTVESMASDAGRTKLTGELLANLKKAYPGEVFQVYLTQFVTQ